MKIKNRIVITVVFALFVQVFLGQEKQAVIDMHVHSYLFEPETIEKLRASGNKDFYGIEGSFSKEEHFKQTYERFKKFNITKAVVSGSLESVSYWKDNDIDNRIIRGVFMKESTDEDLTSERFEALVKDGTIQVFGEIAPYYGGGTISDKEWAPYLKICEEYDIPVGIHTGGGDPGGNSSWAPKSRLRYGDPYLIEDILVEYPKLRVYMMHAGGEDWPERAIRLMDYYPNLYTDIAVMLWVNENTKRYIKQFLQDVKQAGYLDRVLFGSDQMYWPDAIDRSIDYLNSMEFLTENDKQDILYNNAFEFLKLDATQ